MSDFQAIADRGEFTDAAMMRDRSRLASLFTPDGALRMPDVPADFVGPEKILACGERLRSRWDIFVRTTHPGTIHLDGDTTTGRAYIQELVRTRDGHEGVHFAVYHDRYRRTRTAGGSPSGSTRPATSTPLPCRGRRPGGRDGPPGSLDSRRTRPKVGATRGTDARKAWP